MSEAERFRIGRCSVSPRSEPRCSDVRDHARVRHHLARLPNYARSFGVGYDSIGLLISSFSFARLVSDPFVGRYIDRYGERGMATLGAA